MFRREQTDCVMSDREWSMFAVLVVASGRLYDGVHAQTHALSWNGRGSTRQLRFAASTQDFTTGLCDAVAVRIYTATVYFTVVNGCCIEQSSLFRLWTPEHKYTQEVFQKPDHFKQSKIFV